MNKGKRALGVFLVAVLALWSAPLVYLYAYDPLMIFHRPWGRDPSFNASMRLQAAGIINNFEFDSVILGTSMTENTSSVEAQRVFGGRFVNLSLTASDFYERGLVLEHVFRKKKRVSTVLVSLDAGVYGRQGHGVFKPESFAFLYDRNPLNDFRAYVTPHFLQCARHYSLGPECVGHAVDLDRPNAWFGDASQSVRFGGLDRWFAANNDHQVRDALASIADAARRIESGELDRMDEAAARDALAKAERYVDRYLLSYVRLHPETDFHFFFPPYSRIRFALWYQLGQTTAAVHEGMVRYLATMADGLPNLQVHGLEDQNFPDDIALYKDTGHYHPDIDSMLLQVMSEGRHRLHAANVEHYLHTARNKALTFDLVGMGRQIEAYLGSVR